MTPHTSLAPQHAADSLFNSVSGWSGGCQSAAALGPLWKHVLWWDDQCSASCCGVPVPPVSHRLFPVTSHLCLVAPEDGLWAPSSHFDRGTNFVLSVDCKMARCSFLKLAEHTPEDLNEVQSVSALSAVVVVTCNCDSMHFVWCIRSLPVQWMSRNESPLVGCIVTDLFSSSVVCSVVLMKSSVPWRAHLLKHRQVSVCVAFSENGACFF